MTKGVLSNTLLWLACLVAFIASTARNLPSLEIVLRLQRNAEPIDDTSSPGSKDTETKHGASKVRILSYEPFIMHIQDFILPEEREYLLQLSYPLLRPSMVGTNIADKSRTSSSAFLPMNDPIVHRIAQRASQFQGYLEVQDIQATSYQRGQQYRPHVDWYGAADPDSTTDRISTFFAILEADCTNCGTQFPRVPFNSGEKDERLCEFVDCTQSVLTSRNIPGSAIYWRNLDAEGEGRKDTLHAGLPALNGTKLGLNIWTEVDITGKFFDRPSYRKVYV